MSGERGNSKARVITSHSPESSNMLPSCCPASLSVLLLFVHMPGLHFSPSPDTIPCPTNALRVPISSSVPANPDLLTALLMLTLDLTGLFTFSVQGISDYPNSAPVWDNKASLPPDPPWQLTGNILRDTMKCQETISTAGILQQRHKIGAWKKKESKKANKKSIFIFVSIVLLYYCWYWFKLE